MTNVSNEVIPYAIYFIAIIALTMLPYVAAWATSKHLVPSFIISFYYFYLRVSNLKNNEK